MKRMSWMASGLAVAAWLGAGPALAQESALLSSNMFGEQVPEGGGVEGASADFNGEAKPATGELCYYLEVYELAEADGAAIHEGEEGQSGPSVVPLRLPADRNEEVCVTVDKDLLAAMSAEPARYYVAVNTPAHPEGAVRGQLD